MRFTSVCSLIVAVALVAPVGAAEPPLSWPTGELSAHVQAWFAQQHADEASARLFFSHHMAPSGVSIDERLRRRRGMMERTGALTPIEVLESGPASMQVRARTAEGEVVIAMVEGEAVTPHRLMGIRIEAGGDAGGGPRRISVPGPTLSDADAVAGLTRVLEERAKADSFAGAVLLARDGKPLLARAWGLADRVQQTPNTATTRFNLGSIGKVFTRVALAQLAQANKLSLDDKLSRYLPDFPHAGDITLAMLAEHRSGVGDIFNEMYEKSDHSKLRHNHDYLALIRHQPLWFEPGTKARYSNGGYVLLGEVIAKASGEDYYDYLQRHVFAPAGMKSTGAPIEGDGAQHVARG
ncbi:MAG: serine hydrolase domain-containing protein, partial [Candidatus Eisenbacteria bacterium]